MKTIRNFGILAHVDAGKTTITEQMLYKAGALRKLGNVDAGTSVTDSLNVEKERGISVRSAAIRFEYQNTIYNLIDTPGHGDFIGEVERCLSVLDGVVLVLSAAEGIETQTTILWKRLQTLQIPTIILINKTDRMNSDVEKVLEDIGNDLSDEIVVLHKPVSEATNEVTITEKEPNEFEPDTIEKIAEKDDELLMRYLDGEEITGNELQISLINSVKSAKLYPVLFASAKNAVGIDELMNSIIKYLPEPRQTKAEVVSGRIFQIKHDATLGKLSYVRLFSGSIAPRDTITNITASTKEKVNQVFVPTAKGPQSVPKLKVGEVGMVTGLKASQIGDNFGESSQTDTPEISVSPFSVDVVPGNPAEYSKLADALRVLNAEEPNLNFEQDNEEKILSIEVMGYIHIQILEQTIADRFGIEAALSEPTIIYKETIVKAATGYEEYTMPKPCWAVCKFLVEPAKPGSGITFQSKVSIDKIAAKYQKETQRAISGALKQGPLGWEVTDVCITLIGGEDHEVHSRPGDFTIATNMALMKALTAGKTTLLEPILSYSVTIDEEKCGRVMSDILRMRGSYEPPELKDGFAVVKGIVPASTSSNYQITLSSISAGKASFNTSFYGYSPCKTATGTVRDYKGINPLDRAKYILKMRGAITE